MTPQERQLVDDLFDRLARLEDAPRDGDAERAIADGLYRAPNAAYALVQTVLVQDEALKRADARIRELSGADEQAPQGGGFLDTMRSTLTGGARGSVPSVRPNEADPRWNSGGAMAAAPAAQQQAASSPGGSFLGTAAASAVGVIGGALLFSSISSLLGGHHGNSAHAAPFGGSTQPSPWDNNSASGSDLSREAGLDDIGRGAAGNTQGAGLFDTGADDSDTADFADLGGDIGGDGGGDA